MDCVAHPVCYPMVAEGSFPESKAAVPWNCTSSPPYAFTSRCTHIFNSQILYSIRRGKGGISFWARRNPYLGRSNPGCLELSHVCGKALTFKITQWENFVSNTAQVVLCCLQHTVY